jgi:hypothetical protein
MSVFSGINADLVYFYLEHTYTAAVVVVVVGAAVVVVVGAAVVVVVVGPAVVVVVVVGPDPIAITPLSLIVIGYTTEVFVNNCTPYQLVPSP